MDNNKKDFYADDKSILEEVKACVKRNVDREEKLRKDMLDDIRFCTLDQWPETVRNERENDQENGARPCLTIDKINQYIVQTSNDLRQGRPAINVRPQDDKSDIETAKVLKGLIRNIEDQSSADIAYATGGESAIKTGLGFWRVVADYVSEDSFDQDLYIRAIPNTMSTYLGEHLMPDGSDAKEGFIIETLAEHRFSELYPNAKAKGEDFSGLGEMLTYWRTDTAINVVEHYCLRREPMRIHFLADGTTISEEDYTAWPEQAGAKPPVVESRDTYREQLYWAKCTGIEVLEKRKLPGKYIPIVETIGRESNVSGMRVLWGLVRPAKDSLRMYNYWSSLLTEKFALAPKTPYIGAKGQFDGLENRWKNANRKNYPYLEYNAIDVNGNAIPRPERQGPVPMEAAFFQQMQVIEHDVQTSLGMFKAAVGETESQQSGRAILALQKESDTGTYHFGANQGLSIRHTGRILLDLIRHYYDTRRVIRILGEDGQMQTATVDPNAEQGVKGIYNPNLGKYDVSVSVGPSYATKRLEAMTTFVEMAKGAADPASAAVLRYLVMRSSDTAGSEEAAKLLKSLLPPQALQAMSENAPIPPQAQAAMMQMKMQLAQTTEAMQKMHEENMQLKTGAAEGAAKIEADRREAAAKLELKRQEEAASLALTKQKQDAELELARERTAAEIAIKTIQTNADCQLAREKMQIDRESKNTEDAKALAPQLLTGIEKAFAGMQEVLTKIAEIEAQTLAAIQAPKSVSVGNIITGADGNISGATVNSRPITH